MYLKSLALKGFKSFADRTLMSFDPGLTVVVGPNGSGKSNIADAMLWVLGEQSAKMLRGQAMEDVIFSGSSGRSAVGLAEVTLTLDNADHTLPIDFSEIAITRRMYRSGESEYLINGALSRLRDITDILHDSGLGKDTHSIISQGKLDSVLSSRPEERRELIEEAAGISKHRRRKLRSERKIATMQDNLTRAKDIQREINRQLRPLERQVDKAKRHRDLADELSMLTCTLAVDDLRRLQESYAVLEGRGREAEAAIELAQYRLDEKGRDLERYQSLLEQKGIFVGDLGEQRRRMQGVLARMDSDMRLLEEKGKNMVSQLSELRANLSSLEHSQADATREHERVAAELASVRGEEGQLRQDVDALTPKLREVQERHRALSAEVSRLGADQRSSQRDADKEALAHAKLKDQISNAEVEDQMFASRLAQIEDGIATAEEALRGLRAQREKVEDELSGARSQADASARRIEVCQGELACARDAESAARERLSGAKATLSALEALDAQAENSSALVAKLTKDSPELVLARIADLVEAPVELEGLVERILGEDLSALVTATTEGLQELVGHALASGVAGGATIVSLDRVRHAAGQSVPEAGETTGEPLVGQVKAREGFEGLVAALLGRIRLVDGLNEALDASAKDPGHCYVTRDGVVVGTDGRTSVGVVPSGPDQGALERKRRIRAGREALVGLEEVLARAKDEVAGAEGALTTARDASATAKGELARLSGERSSLGSELGRLEAQLRQARFEQAQVSKSRRAARERTAQARAEVENHGRLAREAQERVADLADRLERADADRLSASREERELSDELSGVKLRLATASERKRHLAAREKQLATQLGAIERRLAQTVRTAEALDVVQLRVEPLHRRYEQIRQRAVSWASRLRDRASLAEADSDSLKKTIGDARRAVDDAAGELEAAKARLGDVRVEKGKIEVQVENTIGRITADGHVLEDALRLPAPDDREAMERRIGRLQREIEGIGPVNEIAMDEYAQLKGRGDYIAEQVEDLERAEAALKKIMAAIERKMRRQFVTVFDRVNANFAEIFSLLFPGGQAHLELLEPDHLDETGIEIVAQPRGKRIQKMTLMSGGEKSLTALALLFAVYRARTVPFYVFDEVEAALDDSNLSKLLDAIEALKDTTQLIVISHQRRTMEQADVLYGVSMQADGVSHVVSQRLDKTTGKVVGA